MTLLKLFIPNIIYTPILTGIYMLDTSDNINQLQIENRTYGDNLKHKYKFQIANNFKINIEYMEDY